MHYTVFGIFKNGYDIIVGMEITIKTILIIILINLLVAPILVLLLRKLRFYKKIETDKEIEKRRNKRYYKYMLSNIATPSSFGVLLILLLAIYVSVFKTSSEPLIISSSAILLGTLGFIDDIFEFFLYRKMNRWGMRARYKMPIQILVLFIAILLLSKSFILAGILAIPLAFILNSFNITDGIDGLATGIAIPAFLFLAYLEYIKYGQSSILFLILLVLTFLTTFFVFNIKPAKVFLGDSGSYAIGAILALLTIRYNLLFTIPVIAIFLIEGLSSFIQIFSIKVFKKKFFKIAPLHLDLLNSGWSQWKVILTAWTVQIVISTLTYVIYSYVG